MAAHLLIVDDQPDFLTTIAQVFAAFGYEVTAVPSGAEAVALIQQGWQPDVVMMDFRMPGLDGAATLRRMRELGLRAPSVLVSGVLDEEQVQAEGFDLGVVKSDLPGLTACVQQALERRGAVG